MRVGIPHELTAFEWVRQCMACLQSAMPGLEWISHPERSAAHAPSLCEGDACHPYKKTIRTSLALAPDVDALFIPRLVALDGHLMCPNFRALPDLVRLNLDHSLGAKRPKIIDTVVEIATPGDTRVALDRIAGEIGIEFNSATLGDASSQHATLVSPQQVHRISRIPQERGRIALIGHPYILADPALNLDVPRRLRGHGYEPVTAEHIPFAELDRLAKSRDYYAKTLYWRGARECLGAFLHFMKDPRIDGVIYLISFNCGVDALMRVELASLHKSLQKSSGRRLPFMTLVGDENIQHEHVATRLEAFLDIVEAQS